MQTDTAAPAAIPGLVLRAYAGEADIPDVVRIQNAEWAAVGTRGRVSVDEYVAWWRHPNEKFDPARDVRIAEGDGQIVGFVQSESMDRRVFHRLGASQLDRTICASAGTAGYRATVGASIGTDPERFSQARLILLWGTNTISAKTTKAATIASTAG